VIWFCHFLHCIGTKTPLLQIRKQLIAANAPQKGSSIYRQIQWARSSIQAILRSAKEYAYGFKTYSRAGQSFHIPVEPIIDMPTYELFVKMRAENTTYPKHRKKNDYLLAGHLKCTCNLTWRARTAAHRRSRKGEWVERKTPISTYFCPQLHKELRPPDCPKSVSAKRAETQVWEKLCEFALDPGYLMAHAKRLAYHFEQNQGTLQQNLQQLRDEQVLLTKERQEFITHARVTRMNQEEFSKKIAVHYEKAARVERRETAIENELNAYADLDFDARVSAYVQDLQADLEDVINANPQSDEERHALFLRKRRFVDALLEEAVIDGDRQIHVKFREDILRLVRGNKVA